MGAAEDLQAGVRASRRGAWASARSAFEAALEAALQQEDSAQARDGLGLALWFLGSVAEGIAEREHAFEDYAAAGLCDDAARIAVWISHQHLLGGRASAARGWLARAERAVEDSGASCSGRGWVTVEQARHAARSEDQIALAGRALAVARRCGDGDLEVFALSLLGRAVVAAGRREEGLRLLEEAMAAASAAAAAQRVGNVHTLAEAYCNLIEGCTTLGDWDRAAEWCDLVEQFALSHDTAPLLGACRAMHGDVLLALGQWPQAEQALQRALETHARYVPQMAAPAVASLAELRVRQGRLVDAEQLLAGREEEAASLRALALLRLAEGRPREAAGLLERGLRGVEDHAVRATLLLTPLVEARLECGDRAGAAVAAEQLRSLAAGTGIRLVQAHAALAGARVALADGRRDAAVELARQALTDFGRLAMPLGTAQARLELARALTTKDPELARDAARTAAAVFRRLGSTADAAAAAAVLRNLPGLAADDVRVPGQLTAREQEVLSLVALGMSNAAIASRLVISEKTAGHHVSNILSKLGVRNRTEAAAHART
jgi:ATP/maltotriose-dependent transcriptional regulator MalT